MQCATRPTSAAACVMTCCRRRRLLRTYFFSYILDHTCTWNLVLLQNSLFLLSLWHPTSDAPSFVGRVPSPPAQQRTISSSNSSSLNLTHWFSGIRAVKTTCCFVLGGMQPSSALRTYHARLLNLCFLVHSETAPSPLTLWIYKQP